MTLVDAFDLKILGALQDDGRLTNQELADLAGLSASQCSRRRMRLEEEKVIAGYHADLSSEALGFGVVAFIQVTLATHSPDNSKRFRTLVNRIDEIQEAYSLTGDADYVLKARAARPQGPLQPRQRRADAAPERRACALLDRARQAEGKHASAAEGNQARLKSREIRHSRCARDLR
ncbi:DNA-binding Lrp family transcriptional regulator [Bradyrhizobium sp. GM2.4]